MKQIVTFAVTILIAFTLIACASDKKSNQSKTQETKTMSTAQSSSSNKAPSFTLMDSEGNDLSLSDYAGKVIILDFWATWCPPCRAEIPTFVELQNEYGENGLQVIGVSVDQNGWSVVKPFMEEYMINYPIVLLTDHDIYNAYQELLPPNQRGGIPFTFILDKEGNITEQHVGYKEKAEFEAAITPLF